MATKLILRQLPTSTPATTGASEVKGTPLTNLEVDQNFINLQSAVDGGTSTSPTISGGSINSAPIGATTASSGAFTTLSASGAVTLSSGTANGVPYLNGSKALTAGSALVFDGTNLGIGTTPSAWISNAKALQVGSFLSAWTGSNGSVNLGFGVYEGGTVNTYKYLTTGDAPTTYQQITGAHRWYTAAEGIAGNTISFTQAMTLDASGNLGLGVTPSAWNSSLKALEIGAGTAISNLGSNQTSLVNNGFVNASGLWTYRNNGFATLVQQTSGTNTWSTAPSGTAGNPITFTQAMTLDSSGNLGLGVTPSAWGLPAVESQYGLFAGRGESNFTANAYFNGGWKYIATGTAAQYREYAGTHQWYTAPSGTAGNPITFTQAMTLDASGSLNIANLTASKTVFTDASNNLTTTGTVAVLQGGTGVTTSTGTGSVVLSNSPTLITPALGTPASGVATNLTGLPLTTGVTGQLGVGNGGTGVTTSTGTGSVVLSNSPTLVTPALGTPASGVATNLTGLPLTTGVTGQLGALNGGTGLLGIAAVSIPVANVLNTYTTVSPLGGQSIRVNAGGTAWEAYTPSSGSGSVSSVSVTSGNGFAGTVLTSTSTPAITLSTTVTGVIKGNGAAISAAAAGTDYVAPGTATTYSATQNFAASGITLKGSGTGFTTFASANASVTNYTLTLPAATGTVLTTAAAITADQGGTGQQTYAVGDILYASAATTLSKLSDVATGSSLISGGVGVAPSWGKIGLATHVSGQLGIGNGGTGAATAQLAINALAGAVTSGQYLRGNGTAVVMSTIQAADVPTLNQNTTGSAGSLSATLVATSGGTGQFTYAVGDILYASTTSALSRLADVATGNSLISGGVGAAPSWGKIGLTTHVSGQLAIANGGTGGANATDARTNLGATTVGANLFTLTNPTAVTFPRFNADNTVSTLDAATFRTAIGAGTGTVTSVAALTIGATGTDITSTVATGTTTPVITLNIPTASATNRGALSAADWTTFNNKTSNTGTVTSVSGTGTVSGLTLTGTVTTSGNLTLGGTLAVTAANFTSQLANTFLSAPNGVAGVPTFRAIVAADIPTLNQNTTGTAANVTGQVAIANGGTGSNSASGARTNLGATVIGANLFTLTNPGAIAFPRFNADNTVSTLDAATFRTAIGAGTSSTTGTVTSVSVVSTNGFAGSVATDTSTPAITVTTTVTGVLKGNGTAISAASAGTDYVSPTGTEGISNKTITASSISTSTISGGTFNDGYTEEVFGVSGTAPALSPTNGSIQTWTLPGYSTPTAGTWNSGQSITLMIDDGAGYTVTWSSIGVTWVGGTAPTLDTTKQTIIQLWKVGTVIYGLNSGAA